MSKLLLILSLIGLFILLTFGLIAPDSPVVWMASTSVNFAILRIIMIAILLGLLLTNPPRNIYFRMFVSVFSVILVSWGLSATYDNQMKLLDSMSLLEVAISAGLIALEQPETAEKLPFSRYEIADGNRSRIPKLRKHASA